MSGGSFGYLSGREVEELFECQHLVEQMRDALIELGYAPDAAKETDELLLMLRQYSALIALRQERLAPVWHEMEWWQSNDSDEDDFREALAKYRGEDKP